MFANFCGNKYLITCCSFCIYLYISAHSTCFMLLMRGLRAQRWSQMSHCQCQSSLCADAKHLFTSKNIPLSQHSARDNVHWEGITSLVHSAVRTVQLNDYEDHSLTPHVIINERSTRVLLYANEVLWHEPAMTAAPNTSCGKLTSVML